LKTCKKALAGDNSEDILQTNNKNPILHLITRSVKQKEGTEKGRSKLSTTAAEMSPKGRRSSINPPRRLARPFKDQEQGLKVTQVFCLIYCIFHAEVRTNFRTSP